MGKKEKPFNKNTCVSYNIKVFIALKHIIISTYYITKDDKMNKIRTISYNSFYLLAGCAAHLKASITEIAQLQQPYKNLSRRDCVSLSLASCINGEMT
jgi:hypothetical protein